MARARKQKTTPPEAPREQAPAEPVAPQHTPAPAPVLVPHIAVTVTRRYAGAPALGTPLRVVHTPYVANLISAGFLTPTGGA